MADQKEILDVIIRVPCGLAVAYFNAESQKINGFMQIFNGVTKFKATRKEFTEFGTLYGLPQIGQQVEIDLELIEMLDYTIHIKELNE